MADLKGRLRKKSGEMIRDRVRILYLSFLWFKTNKAKNYIFSDKITMFRSFSSKKKLELFMSKWNTV